MGSLLIIILGLCLCERERERALDFYLSFVSVFMRAYVCMWVHLYFALFLLSVCGVHVLVCLCAPECTFSLHSHTHIRTNSLSLRFYFALNSFRAVMCHASNVGSIAAECLRLF